MRTSALLLALALAGCDSASDTVTAADITGVTVEALPLDREWDNHADDIRDDNDGTGPDVVLWLEAVAPPSVRVEDASVLTDVARDVAPDMLPLHLGVRPGPNRSYVSPFSLRDPVQVVVLDGDRSTRGEWMVEADTLLFSDVLQPGDRPGDERTVTLQWEEARVQVHVRWK